MTIDRTLGAPEPTCLLDLASEHPCHPRAHADLERTTELVAEIRDSVDPVGATLAFAERAAACVEGEPLARRWSFLATVGAGDLTVARTIEPHLDACQILVEARIDPACALPGPEMLTRTWGVYAAEGPDRLHASVGDDGTWRLEGTKHWCSLASRVDAALVTAWDSDTTRRLFAVDLRAAAVSVHEANWSGLGLRQVYTSAVTFNQAAAAPVGESGWYLTRPGFAAGGIGVAALWFGAATSIATKLWEAAAKRPPDQVALMQIGAVWTVLTSARAQLVLAARALAFGDLSDSEAAIVATQVRTAVAGACEEVITRVGHALGPGPLTGDTTHATRIGDLTVYLRQHHAERDLAALGQQLCGQRGR